jgi:hypothetical protein
LYICDWRKKDIEGRVGIDKMAYSCKILSEITQKPAANPANRNVGSKFDLN